MQVAYPFVDGHEIDLGPAGTYTITTRFPETLPANTAFFTLKLHGIEQNRADFFWRFVARRFHERNKVRLARHVDRRLSIEVWYDGVGRHLYA